MCAVVYPNCVGDRLIEPCQSFCEGECLMDSCKLCYFLWWRVTEIKCPSRWGVEGEVMVTQFSQRE